MLVQPVEVDVRKDGTDDPALRNSAERRVEPPVLQVSRLQQRPDQPEETAVVDAFSEDAKQDLMIQSVEKLSDVKLEKPGRAGPGVVHLAQRGVAATAPTETMGVLGELRVVVGVQDEPEHLLQQFVRPGGQSERTPFPVRLRDVRPPDRRPAIPLEAHGVDDGIDLRQAGPVRRLRRRARRHRPTVAGDLAVRKQVQVPNEEQSIDALQRQSSLAAVADDPQERLGVPHHAYLLAWGSSAPALPTRARSRLWPPFEGCPFALWTAFPPAEAGRHAGDYYGGSVAVGLASRRRSRVCAFPTSRARRRRPVRPLDRGRSPTPTRRSVPPTYFPGVSRWPRDSGAVIEGCANHRWGLGFRQSSFRHIARALRSSAFSAF